jgi:hypothetical protein
MAGMLLECAEKAVNDAAMKCVPLLGAAAAAQGFEPPFLQSDEQAGATATNKAMYAAVVCVGRWGELLTIQAEAEGAAKATGAVLETAREAAARGARTAAALVEKTKDARARRG